MQRDRYMHFPTPDYEDIDTLHKTLLHWLVVYMHVYYICMNGGSLHIITKVLCLPLDLSSRLIIVSHKAKK